MALNEILVPSLVCLWVKIPQIPQKLKTQNLKNSNPQKPPKTPKKPQKPKTSSFYLSANYTKFGNLIVKILKGFNGL